ncbi:Asparagine synthase [uncultured archaeon]|nr:Asparagine synthase [uncultured archaeon]
MNPFIKISGWVELDGERLRESDIAAILTADQARISRLGGEFYLEWNGCKARDHFGIMPGGCPSGAIICEGREIGKVDPNYPPQDIGKAIETAVRLRSDEGVVALSGGVDSALVAKLAERECVVVGIEGSHDLLHAREVAKDLGLSLHEVPIDPASIEVALRSVLLVIPKIDPVNASIATTLYFVAEWAGHQGYRRILAGQGADELFGGYARYLQTNDLARDMENDFQGLSLQLARDQAVAKLHGAYFSLPYMDARVVAAARLIPPEEKVCDGVRKRPLREAAKNYLPPSIADYEKKAMQYGSGVMKELQKLAARNGCKKSMQDYLLQICSEENLAIAYQDRMDSSKME